jgi:hypothetical protein
MTRRKAAWLIRARTCSPRRVPRTTRAKRLLRHVSASSHAPACKKPYRLGELGISAPWQAVQA